MGIIVKCPKCNEVNAGSQLYCVKCQASLVGALREEGESPLPDMGSTPPAEQEKKAGSLPPLVYKDEIHPRNPNRNLWIILGVVAAVLCIGLVLCLGIFGTSIVRVSLEREPVASVLDDYMNHMADRDAEGAYALFSPRAQRQIPLSKVRELIAGNNYMIFEGYLSLSISTLNLATAVNTNPDAPQGLVANVSGVVEYEGGIQGTFRGTLEKVDGKWMLDAMYVTVPPDKIKEKIPESDS
jgi:hypothetical protein